MGLNLTPSNYSDLLPLPTALLSFSTLHHQTLTAHQNSMLDGASRIYATDLFCSEKPSCPVWHIGTENRSWLQPLSQNTPTTQPITLQRLQGKGQKNRMPWSSLPKLHSGIIHRSLIEILPNPELCTECCPLYWCLCCTQCIVTASPASLWIFSLSKPCVIRRHLHWPQCLLD